MKDAEWRILYSCPNVYLEGLNKTTDSLDYRVVQTNLLKTEARR
jgi:hypothetical protein